MKETMEKKRQATYTIEIPIRFTVAGDNDMDCKELFDWAVKQAYERLQSGYFDVMENDVEIINKITHYTRKELLEREKAWQKFFKETGAVSL